MAPAICSPTEATIHQPRWVRTVSAMRPITKAWWPKAEKVVASQKKPTAKIHKPIGHGSSRSPARIVTHSDLLAVLIRIKLYAYTAQFLGNADFLTIAGIEQAQHAPFELGHYGPPEGEP